jgi:hypothetical protein
MNGVACTQSTPPFSLRIMRSWLAFFVCALDQR